MRTERVDVSAPGGVVVPVSTRPSAQATRITLRMNAFGAQLTYPVRTPNREIQRFLNHHAAWLSQQMAAQERGLPTVEPGTPFVLALAGTPTSVTWKHEEFPHLRTDPNGSLILGVPLQRPRAHVLAAAHGLLRQHLEQQVRNHVARHMPACVAKLQRSPTAVLIRPLQSIWGCLNRHNRMSLDLALALTPPTVLNYVLIHELCHLYERHHRLSFWRRVGSLDPSWRRQQGWLRLHGGVTKAQLARVLGLRADPAPDPEEDGDDA